LKLEPGVERAGVQEFETGRNMPQNRLSPAENRLSPVAKIGIKQTKEFRPHRVRGRTSACGFYGVHASGERWQAKITYDSKQHHLGTFDTKQEAALAYDRKARKHEKKGLNYESIAAAETAAQRARWVFAAEAGRPRILAQKNSRSASGFYGVHASGERWAAYIHYDSKKHYLGSFGTKQEAAHAYDRKARQYTTSKKFNYESIAAGEAQALHRPGLHFFAQWHE
jgi:hypothetical protein